MQVTGLHEYCADADLVREMLAAAEEPVPPEAAKSCFEILENAGFCTHVGGNGYRLHPALRGYLQQQTPAPEGVQRGFVDVMGTFANWLTQEPFHEARGAYHAHLANLYHAQRLAASLGMDVPAMALTESLAWYALERRQFSEARRLYLDLFEQGKGRDDAKNMAGVLHQLGRVAEEQRDFQTAEGWYQKSLAIWEKQGNEHGAASTYHQLGRIAGEQRDFQAAEGWYQKSLAIEEKQGNEHGAAITYHQLGVIAQEQRDFQAAEEWYQKSLAIEEKHGDEYGAALTYGQLGVLAAKQRDVQSAAAHFLKAIEGFASTGDPYHLAIAVRNYARLLHTAPSSGREALRSRWEEQMPKEMTECLKEAWKNMEEDANDAQE